MNPKEIAEKLILQNATILNHELSELARAYLELEKKNLSLTQAVENYQDQVNSWYRERIDAGHEQVVFELKKEITKLKSENISLKIDYHALENSNRKLNEANERIVEFESIKKSHLAIQDKLKKSREVLREAVVLIENKMPACDCMDAPGIAREAIKADDEIMMS